MKSRRIVKAEVKFLSLVPKGANRLTALYKSDGSFEIDTLVKVTDEGELLAVAYAPEFRDSQGDIASGDVCKQMAHSFAKNGARLDLRHDGVAISKDRAFVAETFLVQKGDPRFVGLTDRQGTVVDPTGGWGVLVKLVDPVLRDHYRTGGWDGVSLGGVAQIVVTEKEAEENWNMDAAELKNIMEAGNVSLAKSITEGVTAAIAQALTKAPVEDVADEEEEDALFKGDPTNPEDVKKHLANLTKIQLLKTTDWSDPVSVAKLHATLEKNASTEDAPEADPAIAELEKELAELRKHSGRSRQAPEGKGKDVVVLIDGMNKEESSVWQKGLDFAADIRKDREAGLCA